MIPSRINRVALTLGEAVIALYPALAHGGPDLSRPVWHGAEASDIQVRDRWLGVETRPTGARHPRKYPLVPQFEITIGRVWALPIERLTGFRPGRRPYVLDLVWKDEETGHWHRETYYGVTIAERNRSSRDVDGGVIENQVFDAQDVVVSAGDGPVPPLTETMAYRVVYRNQDLEEWTIAEHNPETGAFTATGQTPWARVGYENDVWGVWIAGANQALTAIWYDRGISSDGRKMSEISVLAGHAYFYIPGNEHQATTGAVWNGTEYTPAGNVVQPGWYIPTNDKIYLWGENVTEVTARVAVAEELVSLTADGLMRCLLVRPPPPNLPAIEFRYGSERLAAVETIGVLRTPRLVHELPMYEPGRFSLRPGGQLRGTIGADKVVAAGGFQTGDQELEGIIGWYEADDITGLNETVVQRWPDRSGNGNDLLAVGSGARLRRTGYSCVRLTDTLATAQAVVNQDDFTGVLVVRNTLEESNVDVWGHDPSRPPLQTGVRLQMGPERFSKIEPELSAMIDTPTIWQILWFRAETLPADTQRIVMAGAYGMSNSDTADFSPPPAPRMIRVVLNGATAPEVNGAVWVRTLLVFNRALASDEITRVVQLIRAQLPPDIEIPPDNTPVPPGGGREYSGP